MKNKKMRFGIIGCGVVSNVHIKAIREVEEAELAGVSGATAEEAERFAKKYDTRAYASTDALLGDPDVDAVCICTPSGLHHPLSVKAAEAGKHIVIEKPIALTTESADAVIRACKENGVYGTVISQLRFSNAVQETKRALEAGKLGKICMVNLSLKYFRKPEYYSESSWRGTWAMDGGGALMNQGIHGVDILLYLLGMPKTVFGTARTLARPIETEDNAVATFIYENGALGTLCASTTAVPGFQRLLEIHGDTGSIIIRENKIEAWNIPGEEKKEFADEKENILGASDPAAVDTFGHVKQIRDLILSVREERAPFISLEEGKNAVQMITAVYRSSETGRPIVLA